MPPKTERFFFSIKTWGDLFYQPLEMGHQFFLIPMASVNFSVLVSTMAGTF